MPQRAEIQSWHLAAAQLSGSVVGTATPETDALKVLANQVSVPTQPDLWETPGRRRLWQGPDPTTRIHSDSYLPDQSVLKER